MCSGNPQLPALGVGTSRGPTIGKDSLHWGLRREQHSGVDTANCRSPSDPRTLVSGNRCCMRGKVKNNSVAHLSPCSTLLSLGTQSEKSEGIRCRRRSKCCGNAECKASALTYWFPAILPASLCSPLTAHLQTKASLSLSSAALPVTLHWLIHARWTRKLLVDLNSYNTSQTASAIYSAVNSDCFSEEISTSLNFFLDFPAGERSNLWL